MTARPARGRTLPGPMAGPWFDHALVLTLLGVSLADLWMAAYLICRALGLS